MKIEFMADFNSISLFWWSETRLMKKTKENYGDLLSKYLVQKISGKEVVWVQPKKIAWYKSKMVNYLAVGSIIHHANKHSIIWGSGIIDREQFIAPAKFKAVRGPQTKKYLGNLGYQCPETYGDPALLLPDYFYPKISRKYMIGIIPHYNDFKEVTDFFKDAPEIRVIDLMTEDIEKTTIEILECEQIISSSLHGIIVSHAYGIPAVGVKFSDRIFGDGIKYRDYYESVGIMDYELPFLRMSTDFEKLKIFLSDYPSLPEKSRIENLKEQLYLSCPFIISN